MLATTPRRLAVTIAIAIVAVAVAAVFAGFAAFTDTANSQTTVDAGSIQIALAPQNSETTTLLFNPAAPGDQRQLAFSVTNSSDNTIGQLNLEIVGTDTTLGADNDGGLLATDTLGYKVDKCDEPYDSTLVGYEPEQPQVPIYTYTCPGLLISLDSAFQPVTTQGATRNVLTNGNPMPPGTDSWFRVTLQLDPQAPSTTQGDTSLVDFTVTATQRTAQTNSR